MLHAPLLPRAVAIWGAAADAYTRYARLLAIRQRLDAGELFGAADFAKLVAKSLRDGDPPAPPDLDTATGIINAPTGDYGAVGRAAADDWLASCIAKYAAACKAAGDAADKELGDQLPDLRSFAPPPPAPPKAPEPEPAKGGAK